MPFLSLAGLLIIAFLLGGGGRSDINSLVLLRPIGVIATAIGLWSLTREQVRANRFLFGMAVAIFALVMLQLIPLPPSVWHVLPGRELAVLIDRTALNEAIWRPLTLTPFATWNSFFSLFLPFSVLVLGVQIGERHHKMLLALLLVLCAVSGLLGMLQVIGSAESSLYFYEVTNSGAAVGLFANRNHQAILLSAVFPMLAVFAYTAQPEKNKLPIKTWLAIGGAAVLVPLLLVTGSRSGLLLGIVGIAAAAILLRDLPRPERTKASARKPRLTMIRYAVAAGVLLLLALATVFMSRAEAIKRLLEGDELSGPRLPMWALGWDLMLKYFPFGAGFGAITTVYEIDQPKQSLRPTYANHLHNDWLEVIVTGGFLAGFLMIVAALAWSRATIACFRVQGRSDRELLMAKLGSAITLVFVLGSFVDYPLRTPSLACVFVLAAVWLSRRDARSSNYDG